MGGLDFYDLGGGSILLSWPPFPGLAQTSVNIYVNGVLNQSVVGQGLQTLLTESGLQILTEDGTAIALEQAATGTVGGIAQVNGLQAASYANNVVPPAGDGSQRPESLPPVGQITDALTYTFQVVPVANGVELGPGYSGKVTPQPQSVMCVTPMPRGRFGFPNTPGGY